MKTPKYRRQLRQGRGRDRAFLQLDGKRIYLGVYDSPESWERYYQLLAERAAGTTPPPDKSGRQVSRDSTNDLTITELVDRYLDYLEGRVSRPANYHSVLRLLVSMYGRKRVVDFGAPDLLTLQSEMLNGSHCRQSWSPQYVNKQIGRIKRMFRWAVPRRYSPAIVRHDLDCVDPLPVERNPVHPVALEQVHAIHPYVSPQVWAIIELQLLTGARPGEIVQMRAIDVDTTQDPWAYQPSKHKNKHRGKERTIWLGSNAQQIVQQFMTNRSVNAPLFSAREAVESFRRARHATRITPLSCGNTPGTNRRETKGRVAKDVYTTESYGNAIRRACRLANIPAWSPNQLRHTFATQIRAEFGIDVASTLLGHSRIETTQIYAERNDSKARDVVKLIG